MQHGSLLEGQRLLAKSAGAVLPHHFDILHLKKTHLQTQKTQITTKNHITEIIKGSYFQ